MAEPGAAPRVPFAAAARGLLREHVLDAVDELVRTRGWPATTMSDVAVVVGVSRQTLYNEFGSRAAIVEAYIAAKIETLVAAASDAVRAHADDAHAALQDAFALFLQLASDEPVVRVIVAGAGGSTDGEPMRLLTELGQSVAAGQVGALIVEVWPQVEAADAALLAESLVRLAISHALLPSGDADQVARDVGRLLAPFVDRVLGSDDRPA